MELVGKRWARVERARELSSRATAVLDKTRNLVALDAENAYLKWEEAATKLPQSSDGAKAATRLIENTRSDFRGAQKVRIDDILSNEALAAQARSAYNEVLFLQAIALAGIQRATAGGFDPGFAAVPIATQH